MPDAAASEQIATAVPPQDSSPEVPLDISDLLVEDVSIDGMCGVY